jgi:hypothetical protein
MKGSAMAANSVYAFPKGNSDMFPSGLTKQEYAAIHIAAAMAGGLVDRIGLDLFSAHESQIIKRANSIAEGLMESWKPKQEKPT